MLSSGAVRVGESDLYSVSLSSLTVIPKEIVTESHNRIHTKKNAELEMEDTRQSKLRLVEMSG